MDKVFDYIDDHKQEFLDELFEFVRIPSVSPLPGYEAEIQKCAMYGEKIMKECGLKTTIYQTAHNPIVYGETEQRQGRPTILIYGHYDVQPEGNLDEWESDPYEPVIRDGRIYARGVGDNKGQIYAHIKAYQAYCAVKGEPALNIKYIMEGEEEIGSVDLADFAIAYKDLLKADVTIWSDSNIHASGKPLIILGLKGITSMKLSVKGPEVDVHSQWGSVLPNPIWKLINVLSSLKDEWGRVKIPGFYHDLEEPGEDEKAAICNIPSDLQPFVDLWKSPDFDGSMNYVDFFTNFMYEPTINIGCISAGNLNGTKNIVPHEATCWIDMRLGPGQNSEKKRQDFIDYVQSLHVPGVEIEAVGSDAAFTPINNPFVKSTVEILCDIWEAPIIYPGLGGSGPFNVFNNILGAPCIFVPFADAKQHDHAPNENIPVENLILGCKIGAEMLNRFAKIKLPASSFPNTMK